MSRQVIGLEDMGKFASELFDQPREAEKAATILKGILEACSPRLSDLSHAMRGSPQANYKALQRFLERNDPREALRRLYDVGAPFILMDPTEIERPQAKRTEYVGLLKDGKTAGFWLLVLAVPHRGRAIPFHFITYSSRTINEEETSRNLEHLRALGGVRELIGDKPLVMDREFSYQWLLAALVEEGMRFVIRLNRGNRVAIMDEKGRELGLSLAPGERSFWRGVYYRGRVKVNLAGEWHKGVGEPLWVMSNLPPEEALKLYHQRMKIDESFKDMKSLLGLGKAMNKRRENMEKMVAMLLIAYAIGLLVGEEVRDRAYGDGGKMGLLFGPLRAPETEGKAETGGDRTHYSQGLAVL